MNKVFLLLALLGLTLTGLTLGGCGDIEWFPEQTTSTDTPVTPVSTVTAFSLTPKTNVTAGELQTSDPVTVAISGGSAQISVSGAGQYKIGDGAFTASPGTVNNGNTVTVQHTHPVGALETVTTLTIGDKSAPFISTTASTVANVTAFSFAPEANVAPGTLQTSAPVTIAMSGTSAPITVTGGEYSIDGEFTTTAGTVNNGQTVTLRHTSATAGNGQAVTTVTIGDKSATFTSTAVIVSAFSFAPKTGVPLNTQQISAPITVTLTSGTAAPISVTGGQYSIGGGPYTSDAGTVSNNQTVTVRHTSFSVAGHPVDTILTIGDKSATFTSTTAN